MTPYDTFHDILVNLFRDIMSVEERAIITGEFQDITNNDMHIIEAVGVEGAKSMSTIAKAMAVTVGTLTIAINSLVKKGYVTRNRSEKDRRVVLISLTEKGKRAFRHHAQFHDEMIQALLTDLNQEETEVLVRSLVNLKDFFGKQRKK